MQRATPGASLTDDLGAVPRIAARPATTAAALAQNLRDIAGIIGSIDFARYDIRQVHADARPLMIAMFDTRVMLHDQISGWQRREMLTREVQTGLRDVFRLTRYASDMLGEIATGHRTLAEGERTYRGFTGPDFNTLGHPSIQPGAHEPFRSGDILLMRGMAANSAAIARIGDVDSQFSHIGIVHIDEAGRHLVTEALIEVGAVVNPLADTLDHGLGRCIVYRHRDAELAARASRMIHDHVAATRRDGAARSILYDFSMELQGYKRLYCSKLVRQAFDLASGGKLMLPTFKTSLFMKNRDFFKRIGVTATETFAPGDIELEPDFRIVAEWADYRVTSDLRLADLAMDKFFEWMDQHHYRFDETWTIHLIGLFGRFAGQLSEDAKKMMAEVVPQVPPHMSRRTIGTIAMLHKTTEAVTAELRALERSTKHDSGHPMHPRDVYRYLETMRQRDGGQIGYLRAP